MVINKPIFIVGSERSGTTFLYNMLAIHPDVCWFSAITDRFQSFPELSFIHRIVNIPILGVYIKKRIIKATKGHHLVISPREGAGIYNAHFINDRKLTELNMDKGKENSFKKIVQVHLQMTGKSRFLTKRPMNIQRIRLLNAMFPDAYFVHIIRDGRASANSFFQTSWWKDHDFWWLGQQQAQNHKRDPHKRDPIELCALHWQHNVIEVLRNRTLLKNRYMEIRYESFVEDVWGTIASVLDFCHLRQEKKYIELLPECATNMNYKWKKYLSVNQQKTLTATLYPLLAKLGYVKSRIQNGNAP